MRRSALDRLIPAVLAMVALAGCTPAAPPASAGDGPSQPPSPPVQSEFGASHHAALEGVVTGRGGEPLDSVTVVAWRVAEGGGSLAQTRTVTDARGRFRLPLQLTLGPEPRQVRARVVVRGFGYASRYPRGPGGSVALDSTTVAVTLVPVGTTPPVAQARITLPLP